MSLSPRTCCALAVTAGIISVSSSFGQVSTDTFGSGANQFTIDFVTISGDSGDLGPWSAGGYTFRGANRSDYRIGVHEITDDQWKKFSAQVDVPVSGTAKPVTRVSWYAAAEFVNWLNTSTGHQAAYKFTGTQGTADYTFATWSPEEAAGGTNLYRHKDAFYFLPTEDEWVKAAYWNGSTLQKFANATDDDLIDGAPDPTKWNYGPSTTGGLWDVGTGIAEINNTYDMMGNVMEWVESPRSDPDYSPEAIRVFLGGSCLHTARRLESLNRGSNNPYYNVQDLGFRVAAEIPEPTSLSILALGGLALLRRRAS